MSLIIAGSRANLIIALYAPGSPFDNAVNQWRQEATATCQGSKIFEDVATGASGSIDAGSCTDMEQDFWDSLSEIEHLSDFPDVDSLGSSANTAPKLGEPCFGPVSACATSDGCRCIAEVSTESGGQYFTGTCKPSHYAVDEQRLSEVLVEGEDPMNKSKIASAGANGTVGAMALMPAFCPCNCTYVSEACCDAPSGIITESSKLKLGELRPEQCLEELGKAQGRR